MADFDPYHKWLGIPPKDQPPHHYRLLGVELFESDSDVIDAAANKQMAYLQSCANGPKLVISQRLLNEIAAARLCLLNAKQKTAYDVTLKAKLAEQELRKSASASASASKADSSKEPVAEREVEGSQFDFNAEEPFEIHDLIREASTGRLSRIKPTHFFIPKLLVVALLVCIAAGLLIRFGNSNEKPATTDEVAGQSSSTSQDRQRVPNKSPNDRRPSSAKPGPSVTSSERATVNKESQHASPNSSSLSSEQITNSIGMKLTLIPAGEFIMGTSEQSTIRFSDESPQHLVKVSKPFYMGIYEVTQREYAALLSGLNPSIVRNETLPVNNVDWDDAANFCRRLSDKEQRAYRLPTEAEWEYACRAGNNDWLQQSTISEFAWHSNNANQRPHPVGSLKPNPFGLFDMFGNVSEWCHDWYFSGYYADSQMLNPAGPISGTSRICRGGNWDDSTDRCRRAYRGASSPTHRSERLGFRVLLETGAHRESALTAGQVPSVTSGSAEANPSPQATRSEVSAAKEEATSQPQKQTANAGKQIEVKKEQKRPSFIPNDAIHWNEHWYWFSDDKATFQEALLQAQRVKGRLVIIGSMEENRFLAERTRGPTFLGMLKEKGIWNNAIGNRQLFFNWANGQPQNGRGEIYAAIHKDGKWHDYLSDKLLFCIEWGKE